MTISELMAGIEATALNPEVSDGREVSCGYVCDLLSWVMARGQAGMAWVTVQTHLNVIAVASLHDMACVVLPDAIKMEEGPLLKASQEGILVLSSPLCAYEICGRMHQAGLPGPMA